MTKYSRLVSTIIDATTHSYNDGFQNPIKPIQHALHGGSTEICHTNNGNNNGNTKWDPRTDYLLKLFF